MSKDYRDYATKDITPTMEAFHAWLEQETGLKLDPRTVALAGSLRSDFQASEFWKADSRNYKANIEANREAKAQERAVKAKEAAERAIARAKDAEAKANEAAKAAKAKADALAKKAAEEAKAAAKAA